MERTRIIDHKGTAITLLDLSGIPEEARLLDEIARARAFISARAADGSLLTLTHTSGSAYSKAAVAAFRELVTHNRDYVRAGAVVTDQQLHRMVISTLALVTRRNLKAFDDLEAAKDWLTTQ
jgi:hypothetical protein